MNDRPHRTSRSAPHSRARLVGAGYGLAAVITIILLAWTATASAYGHHGGYRSYGYGHGYGYRHGGHRYRQYGRGPRFGLAYGSLLRHRGSLPRGGYRRYDERATEPYVYVQRPQARETRYFCPTSGNYYPHAATCDEAWVAVEPARLDAGAPLRDEENAQP